MEEIPVLVLKIVTVSACAGGIETVPDPFEIPASYRKFKMRQPVRSAAQPLCRFPDDARARKVHGLGPGRGCGVGIFPPRRQSEDVRIEFQLALKLARQQYDASSPKISESPARLTPPCFLHQREYTRVSFTRAADTSAAESALSVIAATCDHWDPRNSVARLRSRHNELPRTIRAGTNERCEIAQRADGFVVYAGLSQFLFGPAQEYRRSSYDRSSALQAGPAPKPWRASCDPCGRPSSNRDAGTSRDFPPVAGLQRALRL